MGFNKNNPVFHALFAASLILMFLLGGCDSGTRRNNANPEYVKKIQEWHKRRIESLTKPTGWLSLAGLFWLNEGANTFGSASSNDIRFPEDRAPGRIGTFFLQDSVVSVKIRPGVKVNTGGAPVDSMVLKNDMTGDPTELSWGSLVWYVIKRGQQYGVRLKDKQNPNLRNFKGIEMFPIDSVWRVKAKYESYPQPKTIEVPTVLGTISEESVPGALVFHLKGKTYRLDPLVEEGEDQFFIIFGDDTNGDETYGAGRFLYADKPGPDGFTIIDFNKAYNPPCAFTPFATCPLPPDQNLLPVKITAGEKKYAGGHHE